MQTSSSADKYLRQLKQIKQQLEVEQHGEDRLARIIQELETDERIEEVLALLYAWFDTTCGNPSPVGSPETTTLTTGGTVQDIFDEVKGTDMEARARDKARVMSALDNWEGRSSEQQEPGALADRD